MQIQGNYQSSMVQQAFSIEMLKGSSEMQSQAIDVLMSGVSELVNSSSRPGIGENVNVYA
jgi:hypothetical protein